MSEAKITYRTMIEIVRSGPRKGRRPDKKRQARRAKLLRVALRLMMKRIEQDLMTRISAGCTAPRSGTIYRPGPFRFFNPDIL